MPEKPNGESPYPLEPDIHLMPPPRAPKTPGEASADLENALVGAALNRELPSKQIYQHLDPTCPKPENITRDTTVIGRIQTELKRSSSERTSELYCAGCNKIEPFANFAVLERPVQE